MRGYASLSPEVRHAIVVIVSAMLAWAASVAVPFLNGQTGLTAALGAVLTAILAVLTPAVQAYGVGSNDAAGNHDRHGE